MVAVSAMAQQQHQPVHIPPLPKDATTQLLDPTQPIRTYTHKIWKTEQGLPQNSAWTICQTQEGYIWIGTEEGLARFDGARFTVFNKVNTPALQHNWVLELLEIPRSGGKADSKADGKPGTLWFGTNGGLHRLEKGVITSFTTKDGLSSDLIVSLLYDPRDSALWIATRGFGLNRYHNGKFTTYTTKDGLSSNFIHGLVQDNAGALWIGTDGGGLNRFHNGKFTALTTNDGLSNNNVWALWLDSAADPKNPTLWIGTNGGGLNRLQNGHFTHFTTKNSGLSSDIITSLWKDKRGALWIATWGGGVNRLYHDTITSFTTKDGLSHDVVYSVMTDREGALWVGTQGGGVNRFQNNSFTTTTTKNGLPNDFAVTMLEEPATTTTMPPSLKSPHNSASIPNTPTMWFGTYGGLSRLENGVRTNYTTANGLSNNSVHALARDSGGAQSSLWIGTWGGGLNRLQNGHFTHISPKDGLLGAIVTSVLPDNSADGSLWIGTWGGLNKRLPDGKFTSYTIQQGLPSNFIFTILQDRLDSAIWIGTWGGGVSRLYKNVVTHYSTEQGLSNKFIRTFMQDRDGVLWIGTVGGGLNRLHNGKIRSITTNDGLFDDHIWSIVEDDDGWLWMACNRGIFRAQKAELNALAAGTIKRISCQHFGTADGMKSAECNGGTPSVWKARDGRLYFPTMQGFVSVHPRNMMTNRVAPPVIIEEIIADSTMTDLSDAATMPQGAEKFEFHYTATSLHTPEAVRFKYLLEGFDGAWTDAGTRRVAYYTHLPRGRSYRFRVIACNNDGVWNDIGATAVFYLTPYFWETWWFFGVCGVLVLSSGYGFFLMRVRNLQRRALELRRTVAERTAEVNEANSEIQRQMEIQAEQAREVEIANTELSEKNLALDNAVQALKQAQSQLVHAEKMAVAGQLTAGVMHEINNPNAAIYAALHDLNRVHTTIEQYFFSLLDAQSKESQKAKRFKEILDDANHITQIALTGSERIKSIVGGLQHFTKHQRDGMMKGIVLDEIAATVAMFRYQFKETQVRLAIEKDLHLTIHWGEFNQVLLNILVNAAQAGATELVLTAYQTHHTATLTIADNGQGMTEEVQKRLFEPFFTTKPIGKGTGLGMAIAYGIIEKHGGRITVESIVGKGTVFTIVLPASPPDATV
jgi:signal transduction histidine kinase/ligand-binding sensor domain-containing protein